MSALLKRIFREGFAVMGLAAVILCVGRPVLAAELEKEELTFGFIKLTDCVPLVIAKEKGFFEEEGLSVTLQAQANWKVLMDRVISGELDGAHMLAPAPLGAALNLGTKADIVVPYVLSVNGAAITVSNEVWNKMKKNVPQEDGKPVHPIKADALKPVLEEYINDGDTMKMAMTFPAGTHNVILRYWLAAGGINPGQYTASDTNGWTDAEVLLSVTPPPQMAATLESATISGYCVGEPWNQQAVFKGIGAPVTSSYYVNRNLPDKVFGVTKEWAAANPNTYKAVVKALIRAGQWLDADKKNRREASFLLSQPQYVGADAEVIVNSLTGTFEYERGDKREEPDWNVFFRDSASYPYYSGAVWWLTQLRRWGMISEAQTDQWYVDLAKKVFDPAAWNAAAKELVAEGKLEAAVIPETDGFKELSAGNFIDGIAFDGKKPNEYLKKFAVGNKE